MAARGSEEDGVWAVPSAAGAAAAGAAATGASGVVAWGAAVGAEARAGPEERFAGCLFVTGGATVGLFTSSLRAGTTDATEAAGAGFVSGRSTGAVPPP